jgi:DNA-directed RNA polymerase II subunit RPB2
MKKKRIIKSTADHWSITLIRTKLEPTINHGHTRNQTEEWIDYKGKVYCLTVRTGIFLMRENMKPVFTGNSRAAQKSTIGMVYRQEDMPFTESGMVPDMIINPHAMPSRMTVNQLLECALGKTCVLKGEFGDCTAFSNPNIAHKISDELKRLGYEDCTEVLYNGFTGERLDARIMMGPTYYQRLKHLVSDKMHARACGMVTTLTRQPPEGRSRNGGLRVGEMETWSQFASGCSRFLKERVFDCSDAFTVIVCKKCGYITNSSKICNTCKTDDVQRVNLPYSSKLLLQELQCVGIKMKMLTS